MIVLKNIFQLLCIRRCHYSIQIMHNWHNCALKEIQDGIQNVCKIQMPNYRVNYTDLKVKVCSHFDQIKKGS